MVDGFATRIPTEFRTGIVVLEVSPKAVPDPLRRDVFTLGECIPLEWSGNGANLQSRIILYHGSFAALARSASTGFDWRQEAWDTLTHELRHHLEWRANVRALEAYDWATEQNFARQAGEPFDPVFYRSGERLAAGLYKVEDDVFFEATAESLTWHGGRYRVTAPLNLRPPLFVTLEGLVPPPAGEAILVVLRRPSLWDLLRRRHPKVATHAAPVEVLDA